MLGYSAFVSLLATTTSLASALPRPPLMWAVDIGSEPSVPSVGSTFVGSGHDIFVGSSNGSMSFIYPATKQMSAYTWDVCTSPRKSYDFPNGCSATNGSFGSFTSSLGTWVLVRSGNMVYLLQNCPPLPAQWGKCVKWSFTANSTITTLSATSPAVSSIVFIASAQNNVSTLYSLDVKTGNVNWALELSGTLSSRAVVAPNGVVVYVGASDGRLHAVDCITGAIAWSFETGGAVATSVPSQDATTVYAFSGDNTVYAIDTTTGHKKWTFASGHPSAGCLSPDASKLYVAANNMLSALETTMGHLIWSMTAGIKTLSAPLLSALGDVIYIGSADHNLYALNTKSGTIVWAFPTGGAISNKPALAPDGKAVFASSADQHVYAVSTEGIAGYIWSVNFDSTLTGPVVSLKGSTLYTQVNSVGIVAVAAVDGSTVWKSAVGRGQPTVQSYITLDGDRDVLFSGGTRIHAMATVTGILLWMFASPRPSPDPLFSTPVLSLNGDTVFAQSNDNYLYAVWAFTGSYRWSFQLSTQSPGVFPSPTLSPDGALIFVASSPFDRKLYAIDTSTGKMNWSYASTTQILTQSSVSKDGLTVFMNSLNQYHALDSKTGQLLWTFNPIEGSSGASSSATGLSPDNKTVFLVYGAGVSGLSTERVTAAVTVFAVDAAQGVKKWQVTKVVACTTGNSLPTPSPVVSADSSTVYVALGSSIYALETALGNIKWEFTTEAAIQSRPTLSPDGVYLYLSSGTSLYALHAGDGLSVATPQLGGFAALIIRLLQGIVKCFY